MNFLELRFGEVRSAPSPWSRGLNLGGAIIRLAGIICVLCTAGHAPLILYIRRPARLGTAGPSDLTALQNSREVHTLRLATARNRSTPRVWLTCRQLATHPPHSPVRAPLGCHGAVILLQRTSENSVKAKFAEFTFHALQTPSDRAIAYLAGSFLALRYPSGVYSVPGGKFLGTNPRFYRESEKRRRGSSHSDSIGSVPYVRFVVRSVPASPLIQVA